MDADKVDEMRHDLTISCGCIELGDYCYDRLGNPTHASNEECNP